MRTFSIPPLGAHEVHVWSCNLPAEAEPVAALASLLSPDEQSRAARFRFDVHRRRFIAARGTARLLLGAYVMRDGASLRFEYEPLGKPRLSGGDVAFNVSHCDDRMLLAVRRGGDIGVDVERIRPIADAESIAGRYFTEEEAERIRSAAEPLRSHFFLRSWTRHEARGKFAGRGVVPVRELHTEVQVLDLATPGEHVAAVALDCGSFNAVFDATVQPPHYREGLTCHGFSLS